MGDSSGQRPAEAGSWIHHVARKARVKRSEGSVVVTERSRPSQPGSRGNVGCVSFLPLQNLPPARLPLFPAPRPQPANVLLVREQGSNRLVAKVRGRVDLGHL